MRIIIPYSYDPCTLTEGGGIKYVHNLLKILLKNRIDTTLLGIQITDQIFTHPKLTFIPICKKRDNWYRFLISLMFKVPFLKIPKSAIIHSNRLLFVFPFVLFYPKNPKICTLHGKTLEVVRLNYPRLLKPVSAIYKTIESYCLKNTDRIIAGSQYIKQAFEERHPWIKGKIKIIPTGIDLDEFKPMDKVKIRRKYGFEPDEKIILFAGRLEKIKNLDFLIRAFASVKEYVPRAKLVIVGRGSEMERLINLASDLDLNNKIVFMGQQASERIPEIFNCTDVFVLCSITEGSPTVVREALACGIPVVSTDVGDVRYVIENEGIGKIAERDERSFADAIIDVFNMIDEEPEKVMEKCRNSSKKFGFGEIGQEIMKIYEELSEKE